MWLLIALWSCFFLAMAGGIKLNSMLDEEIYTKDEIQQEKIKLSAGKHKWFCLKPVRINGQLVWFKYVYRDLEIIERYGRYYPNPMGPSYSLIDEKLE